MSVAISDLDWALARLSFHRQTHLHWAEHFEKHPEIEAQYVATGDWDSAAEHRVVVAAYDRLLQLLADVRPFVEQQQPPLTPTAA